MLKFLRRHASGGSSNRQDSRLWICVLGFESLSPSLNEKDAESMTRRLFFFLNIAVVDLAAQPRYELLLIRSAHSQADVVHMKIGAVLTRIADGVKHKSHGLLWI